MLTELDPDEVELPESVAEAVQLHPAPAPAAGCPPGRRPGPVAARTAGRASDGALAGSVLSPEHVAPGAGRGARRAS